MNATRPEIHPEMLLPDLLRQYPQARTVFDRYGLSGCGGAHGPHETVRFFSRTHGVEESQLLEELRLALGTPSDTASQAPDTTAIPSVADTIYRRFFLAGIAVVLTAGASWGAWLLWRIGINKDFTAISIHHINAHGHAQIFGWVGLFIMGFAYQAFPRLWHRPLAAPRLAVAAFVAMLVGLIVRTAGMTAPGAGWALDAVIGGGALELAAIITFAAQLLFTFWKSGARLEPYVAFAVAALLFYIAQAGLSVWHTRETMTASSREALLWQVATWQAPLRDLQIHGLALFMIVGVSLRMLPALFDLPRISPGRAWGAFALLLAAVAGEIATFLAYRYTGNHRLAALLLAPWLMLAGGVALAVWPWRLWKPLRTHEGGPDRIAKFIRAAWGWLAISLLMLLLFPVYQYASGLAFSHAYYGAIRHAITVGFISLMIMGYAAKVVPTLAGRDPRGLSALWLPFWLVNVGCFLRVATQTLTDWHPAFFAMVGISGTLEVTGLAIWGTHLAAIMWTARREERTADDAVPGSAPDRIEGRHRVAQVLAWFPQTEPVFVAHGFGAVRNPVLRRTVARRVSLSQVAVMHNVRLDLLLAELNRAAGASEEQQPLELSGGIQRTQREKARKKILAYVDNSDI